jgi:hypothetical protein
MITPHPPHPRLARMQKSFEKNKSVLADDYAYFISPTADATPHAPIPQNKAEHKLAERIERQSPRQSETPSSGKTGD